MNKLWGREILNKHNKNRACKAMQESQPTMEQIKKKHGGTNKRVVTGVFFYPKNTMNKSWKRLLSEILSLLPSCESSWACILSSVLVLGDITMHQLNSGGSAHWQCGACIKMLMLIPESPVFMFKRICAVQTGWTTKQTLNAYWPLVHWEQMQHLLWLSLYHRWLHCSTTTDHIGVLWSQ